MFDLNTFFERNKDARRKICISNNYFTQVIITCFKYFKNLYIRKSIISLSQALNLFKIYILNLP